MPLTVHRGLSTGGSPGSAGTAGGIGSGGWTATPPPGAKSYSATARRARSPATATAPRPVGKGAMPRKLYPGGRVALSRVCARRAVDHRRAPGPAVHHGVDQRQPTVAAEGGRTPEEAVQRHVPHALVRGVQDVNRALLAVDHLATDEDRRVPG